MADIDILSTSTAAAPKDFTIAGALEILLKNVTASFDGTGAGGSFVPALQIVDPAGVIVGTYPIDTTLAAGASADVSWFPRLRGQTAVAELTTFHDPADDGFNQARWAINTFVIRNALLDTVASTAWSQSTVTPYTAPITLSTTGELVYAFTDKDYIRGLTSNAPFTDLYAEQVPDCVSCAQLFAARASGQGSGVVTYSAVIPAGDLVDPHPLQNILVGFKPNGGVPTQVALYTTYVQNNPWFVPPLPPTLTSQPGDIELISFFERNGNAISAVVATGGWTLLARSPDRNSDPNAGQLDQYVFMRTI